MMVGWGISAGILFTTIALQYDNYGATYQCWLDLQHFDLAVAQLIPLIVLIILIFTMIEAAGNADYKSLNVNTKSSLSHDFAIMKSVRVPSQSCYSIRKAHIFFS